MNFTCASFSTSRQKWIIPAMYLREQDEDVNRVSERGWFNKSEKRARERNQASICREGVRRHAFWQELKKTAVFGVVFLNASMLLQSPRLA